MISHHAVTQGKEETGSLYYIQLVMLLTLPVRSEIPPIK